LDKNKLLGGGGRNKTPAHRQPDHAPGGFHVLGRIGNQRGDVVQFTVIFPVLLFIIIFALSWGVGVYTKMAMTTAAREAARTYAVTHDEEAARFVAADIAKNILGADVSDELVDRFKKNNVYLEKVDIDGSTYCRSIVVFKLPIPAWTGVNSFKPGGIKVGGEALFREEFIPPEGS